jgi:hypothetical protein
MTSAIWHQDHPDVSRTAEEAMRKTLAEESEWASSQACRVRAFVSTPAVAYAPRHRKNADKVPYLGANRPVA